jgi:acyl dehydratase
MTLFLQDLDEGQTFSSSGRTITEADIMNFAGVSGDFNPLHTDETWVREHTHFRGRIAHGLLVLSATSGLATPGLDDLETIAYVQVTRKMVGPVYPGDTIRAVHRINSVRPSRSRPNQGIVTIDVEVRNQDGELVQSGTDVVLIAADPERAADAAVSA